MQERTHRQPFDVAILGGGSAGYAAARTAAAAGLKTAVIDGAKELGGLCILRGCMPSKTLLYASEVLHLARKARTWGLRIPKVGFDFRAVMARKQAMIAEFTKDRRQSLTAGKFQLFRASARFIDPHTVALSDARERAPEIIKARHFVIASGSSIQPPTLPGLQEIGYLTSDDILSLPKLPRSVIVLGAGPVAVELAQFLARFDVEVTMLQRGRHLLRDLDEDASNVIQEVLQREGVRIHAGTTVIEAFAGKKGKGIKFRHHGRTRRVTAEEIFLAWGRTPSTAALDLENAGVKTERGRIVADAHMQTSAPHIYAAGDCTGPFEIVHLAVEQGEIAAHNLAYPAKPRKMDYRLLTNVVFTEPQAATVGLTEKVARAQKIRYHTASYPFNDHGKSLIMEAKDGFVKLLADPASGEIIGGACVGPLGGELIHEIIAAMHCRMTARDLSLMPHYHPTLAEIWTYPASDLAEHLSSGKEF